MCAVWTRRRKRKSRKAYPRETLGTSWVALEAARSSAPLRIPSRRPLPLSLFVSTIHRRNRPKPPLRDDTNSRAEHYCVDAKIRSISREVPLAEAPLDELEKNLVDQADTPSSEAQARERNEVLHQALTQLPERSRKVLLLHI
jgi:DNA-directed RNA polymerase specialized sigma24 family protein